MRPAGKRFRASCPRSAAQGRVGSLRLGRRSGQAPAPRRHVTGERCCLGWPPALSRAAVVLLSCSLPHLVPSGLFTLECHPNRSSRVLGWGPQALQPRRAAPAAAMGCVGGAAGGRRSWEQGQLPAVTEPSRRSLDTAPSSCRVPLASVRWQLPPPRMRRQGRWRQVRQRSTGPGPGGELWGGWGAGFSGRGRGLGFSWMPGVDGGRHRADFVSCLLHRSFQRHQQPAVAV